MVYSLLSEWCVVTSFYQRSANRVSISSFFYCTLSRMVHPWFNVLVCSSMLFPFPHPISKCRAEAIFTLKFTMFCTAFVLRFFCQDSRHQAPFFHGTNRAHPWHKSGTKCRKCCETIEYENTDFSLNYQIFLNIIKRCKKPKMQFIPGLSSVRVGSPLPYRSKPKWLAPFFLVNPFPKRRTEAAAHRERLGYACGICPFDA